MDFLQSTDVWVLISTIVFIIVAIKKGKTPILNILDSRTARIEKEIEEAERLRVEAQEILADYQRKHRDALKTANDIIENASERAARIEADMMKKMDEDLARKETQLVDRIARAEKAAIQEIRNKAADIATATVVSILSKEMNTKDSELIDDAIKNLPQKLKA